MKSFFSLLDLGESIKEVPKIFGANFAIRKSYFSLPIFKQRFGRSKNKQLGGEETELCKDAQNKGYKVYYEPRAVISHYIPKKRTTALKILKKAYFDGFSRGMRRNKPNPVGSKYNIYDYIFLFFISIPYFLGFSLGFIRSPK